MLIVECDPTTPALADNPEAVADLMGRPIANRSGRRRDRTDRGPCHRRGRQI